MVNERVLTVSILLRFLGPLLASTGTSQPHFGGRFAHVAPCRDLSPSVAKLADPGPGAATCANGGGGRPLRSSIECRWWRRRRGGWSRTVHQLRGRSWDIRRRGFSRNTSSVA
jgi:hypothetical protein